MQPECYIHNKINLKKEKESQYCCGWRDLLAGDVCTVVGSSTAACNWLQGNAMPLASVVICMHMHTLTYRLIHKIKSKVHLLKKLKMVGGRA